jgi:hypothetical protein
MAGDRDRRAWTSGAVAVSRACATVGRFVAGLARGVVVARWAATLGSSVIAGCDGTGRSGSRAAASEGGGAEEAARPLRSRVAGSDAAAAVIDAGVGDKVGAAVRWTVTGGDVRGPVIDAGDDGGAVARWRPIGGGRGSSPAVVASGSGRISAGSAGGLATQATAGVARRTTAGSPSGGAAAVEASRMAGAGGLGGRIGAGSSPLVTGPSFATAGLGPAAG